MEKLHHLINYGEIVKKLLDFLISVKVDKDIDAIYMWALSDSYIMTGKPKLETKAQRVDTCIFGEP